MSITVVVTPRDDSETRPARRSDITDLNDLNPLTGGSGNVGIPGSSGHSGYSGIGGESGLSGNSGYSGYTGISGWSGERGPFGLSGTSGYSGYSGIGISGASGTSGQQGPNGGTGISGFTGVSGFSGGGSGNGALFTVTDNAQAANTTSETSIFGNGVGTKTISANAFTAGRRLRIRLGGIYNTNAIGSRTLDIRMKLGSTLICNTAAKTVGTGGATSDCFIFDVSVTCRTTGVSGTFYVDGTARYLISSGTTQEFSFNSDEAALGALGAEITLDTTISQALTITAIWGQADPSNIISGREGIVIFEN